MLSVDDTLAEVYFVDYGDSEWVSKESIQPIHSSLLQVCALFLECIVIPGYTTFPLQLPFQAIECSLKNSNGQFKTVTGTEYTLHYDVRGCVF